jgi:dephospho-CoA kinase
MIIGIIGQKKAGKETVAKYLAHVYGFKLHAHSDVLREILGVLNQPLTRMNHIKMVALRKVFGEYALVNALNKRIQTDLENGPVVVTGIRFQNELDNIKQYPDSKLIFIDAPAEKRFEWQKHDSADKEDDGSMQEDEFHRIDKNEETEVNIVKLGELADYKIDNSGTKEDLYKKVDQIMQEIKDVGSK